MRFHDEVRVKSIKAKGKNLPVGTAFEIVEEDEEEEFGEKISSSEDDSEEDSDTGPPSSEDDQSMGSEDGSEEGSDEGINTQDTIERLKDDLFADDDGEDDNLAGRCLRLRIN